MLHYIVLTASITFCLVVGIFAHRTREHTKHKPLKRWMRCGVCHSYQNTAYSYCTNHQRPVWLLEASQRQQRRIHYHLGYLWQYPHLQRHQHDFIAFVMRLEEMTQDAWSTHAAISVHENIGAHYLQEFVDFMSEMEEATGKRLDTNDLINQFSPGKRMEDGKEKIAQN